MISVEGCFKAEPLILRYLKGLAATRKTALYQYCVLYLLRRYRKLYLKCMCMAVLKPN